MSRAKEKLLSSMRETGLGNFRMIDGPPQRDQVPMLYGRDGTWSWGQTEEIQIHLHPLESHGLQWRTEIQIHKPSINYFLGL